MPKLTQKQLSEFLSKLLSQDVELVENDADSEFDENAFLSAVDKSRTPIIKQLVQKDIHGQALRTTNDAYRKGLSSVTGLPLADMADLEGDALLAKALEHYKGTLPDNSKDTQKKIDDMLAAHALEKANLAKEWETKYTESEKRLTRKSQLDVLRKYHIDAKGLPEKANRDKLAEVFLSHLEGNAIVKMNEKGDDIELYDPKSPELRLLNSSLNTQLGVSDFMKPYYSDLGMWNEDTREVAATTAAKNARTGIADTTQQNSSQPAGNMANAYGEFAAQFK